MGRAGRRRGGAAAGQRDMLCDLNLPDALPLCVLQVVGKVRPYVAPAAADAALRLDSTRASRQSPR